MRSPTSHLHGAVKEEEEARAQVSASQTPQGPTYRYLINTSPPL
jgi:hypothetical protein